MPPYVGLNRKTRWRLHTIRVRNEKIDCHRFSGIASQRVEWVDPDIEQVKREAPCPFFLQEKQKHLK